MFPTISNLLLEVTMQQVEQRFEGKKFRRAIQKHVKLPGALETTPGEVVVMVKGLVPEDIPEASKAEALNWAISIFISGELGKHMNAKHGGIDIYVDLVSDIETFYQTKEAGLDHLLDERDIYRYTDVAAFMDDMQDVVVKLANHRAGKVNPTLAAEGLNLIGETPEWQIFIPENKAAACKLGQNTKWCTAAPGLNYYEEYHSEDDPLIIFKHKKDEEKDLQFHFAIPSDGPPRRGQYIDYGLYSGGDYSQWYEDHGQHEEGQGPQFSDVNDRPVAFQVVKTMVHILKRMPKLPRKVKDYLEHDFDVNAIDFSHA